MKITTNINHRNLSLDSRLRGRYRRCSVATAFMTALALAAAPLSQAAQLTWSGGGGDANWSTGANWAGTAPVSNDALKFAGLTNLTTNNDISGLSLVNGGTPAATIHFANTSTATGGAFTLNGNAITLGGAIRTEAMTTGSLTDVINLQLNLAGTRTVNTLANHNLTINGLINETSSGVGGITKTGGATLTLTNASNNFTAFTAQQGTVTATSIEPSGTTSAIGAGNNITLGGATVSGTLNFTGTAAPSGNINRTITLAESTVGGVINNNGTVPLVFNGSFVASGNNARAMTFGGSNNGANEFQNTLVNAAGGGALTVVKADGGTWTLSGPNTYTGQTNINNGTLNVATIADSGSSNLGLGTLIRIGTGGTTGTLNYTGTGSTTSRTFTIGNNSGTPAAGDTGGATINNNGTGALVFTAANFNTTGLTGSLAPSRSLTLGGSNTGANEIQGVIADGLAGTMTTVVVKSDAGTWTLSGANTYTGQTQINNGTLNVANIADSGSSNLGLGTSIRFGNGANTGTLNYTGTGSTTSRTITIGNGNAVADNGGATINNNGTGALVFTAANFNTTGLSGGANTRTLTLGGSNTGANEIQGVIADSNNGTGKLTNLVKTGGGTWMLSGANTYTGTTVVNAGTLKLGASNVLPDTNVTVGSNNAVVTTSALDLNGFSDTILALTLGRGTTTVAGATASVVNNGGGSPVLTLGGVLTYSAGSVGFLNGQATISADLATGAATRNFTVGNGAATDDLVITGVLQAGGGFSVNGGGTMRLDNPSNNHGISQIAGGSTLKLGANSVLGTANVNLNQAVAGTSTLDLNGKTDAVGAGLNLSNSVTTALGASNQIIDSAGGGVLQLNGAVTYNAGGAGFNNGSTTISAALDLNGTNRNFNINDSDQALQDVVISGAIQNSTGTAGIIKNNAGTLVLSNANTYNGNTTVSAGTLEVNNTSGSGTGTGAVIVNSTLIGDGSIVAGLNRNITVDGAMTVGATGATAGSDFSFTTSGTGSTIFGSSSFLNLDLWSTTGTDQTGSLAAADMLRLFGSLDITAGATLKLNNPNALTFQLGDIFRLFDWTGSTTPSTFFVEDFSAITLNPGLNIDTSNLYTSGTISIVNAIPEPSRALLLFLGGLSLFARRRRAPAKCSDYAL